MAVKVSHQPLLAPGRHILTIEQLKVLTVTSFPSSTRRPFLFQELERLHAELMEVGAVCELWIDGSFLTQKPEPNDIDLCFAAFASDFNMLETSVRNNIWLNLNGGKQYSPYLDTYLCFRFLREDPRAKADTTDDWSEKWGVGWDNYLTGFVVIKYGESDVSVKLFA